MRPVRAISFFICILVSISCKDRLKPGEMGVYNVGEHIQVGPLIYTVVDTQWMTNLGEGPTQRIPVNRFMTINLTVVNGGGGNADLSVPSFSLIDDSGQTYIELPDGEGVQQWLGFVRKVRPAETATGNVLFDVPQKHFKLKVADENDQRFAYIDIPLNFGEPPVKVQDAPAPPAPRLATPK